MQRRDKDHLIAVFELVLALSFQLPIRVVDEYEDSWSSTGSYSISTAHALNAFFLRPKQMKRATTYTVPFSMKSSARSVNI